VSHENENISMASIFIHILNINQHLALKIQEKDIEMIRKTEIKTAFLRENLLKSCIRLRQMNVVFG
jgi:hypothetical protein